MTVSACNPVICCHLSAVSYRCYVLERPTIANNLSGFRTLTRKHEIVTHCRGL